MLRNVSIPDTAIFCLIFFSIGLAEQGKFENWPSLAKSMVRTQIQNRGITDTLVLHALLTTPRHEFVPDEIRLYAYSDQALPIWEGQTISQPYIVALMTDLLDLTGEERVLEIGTGSGYQAAILSGLCRKVYSIEIIEKLAKYAEKNLSRLNIDNVEILWGNGYLGWPEKAPFDRIIVTAAPPEVPQALIDQLKPGGKMILPVGEYWQELILIEKTVSNHIEKTSIIPVRFVPMMDIEPH